MSEVWLKSNQRVMLSAMIFPFIGMVAGVAAFALADHWLRWLGLAIAILGLAMLGLLTAMRRRPVLARDGEHLLVYLNSGEPERIPIEFVEVFFRGEGPIQPGDDDDEGPNAANIVVRLAERAEEWKHRDVRRAMGHWCDGYITIRGMWCEPIDVQLMEQLNKRLVAVHRARREAAAEARRPANETQAEGQA